MGVNNKSNRLVRFLAQYGIVSIGVVYILVGVIAILSLLGLKDGGADEDSILEFLKRLPLGEVAIWLILGGMIGYIIWRIFEAIKDPYEYGSEFKAIVKRIGIGLSAVAYGIIAVSAFQALLGLDTGNEGVEEQQILVAQVFEFPGGEWLVGAGGVLAGITGILEFKYVIFGDYEPRLDISHLSKIKKTLINIFAWVGHFARGIILLIISYFFILAAIESDPKDVVNTDKAFDFIGGSMLGHPLFVAIASGTICYGLFMIVFAVYYDFNKD